MTDTTTHQATAPTPAGAAQDKVRALRAELKSQLVERDREVDGLLTALLAGEHALLLGPAGTAKSLATRLLCGALDGATYFEWLLTRFSLPEELFGPYSVAAIKRDEYRRVTSGKLPEASIAFLDEVFKANSAILNALLALLNERVFHNGTRGASPVPLTMAVGASNELPEGDDVLAALYDRFLIRFWVSPIADRENMRRMVTAPEPSCFARLTGPELAAARAGAAAVELGPDIVDLVLGIKDRLSEAGFAASDRRWKKTLKVLRARAYLCGEAVVMPEHAMVLADMLWTEPKDRVDLARLVAKQANPMASVVVEVMDAARAEWRRIPMSNLTPPDKMAVVSASAEVKAALKTAIRQLAGLCNGGARPTIVDEGIEELKRMDVATDRYLSQLMGMGSSAV